MMDDNFIFQCYLSDLSICDRLIYYFENHQGKGPGLSFNLKEKKRVLDKEIKDSTDVCVDMFNEYTKDYFLELKKINALYKEKFTYAGHYSRYGFTEYPNIQHYEPGQGFKEWHTERSNSLKPTADRHLVYMTYLNDVTDGGETEFYYQKLSVQPKKGLTLIWPADWTYTHRGVISPTQDKYIITGWLNFIDK